MVKINAALILVDLQNDFCAGGSLAVPEGDAVIALANQLQTHFQWIIATQDWHTRDHSSFASNHPGKKIGDVIDLNGIEQILWPDHCVQGTKGAALHPDLATSGIQKIFFKGSDKHIDSYSAFYDNAHLRDTGLAAYLKENGIQIIYIMGLATDYCVKYTCIDGVKLGFETYVIADGCRGVELHSGDIDHAFREMHDQGVKMIGSGDIL